MNAPTRNFLAATFIGKHADAAEQAEILDMLGLADEFGMCTADDDRVWAVGVAGPVGGRSESNLSETKFDARPKRSTAPESLRVLPPLELVRRQAARRPGSKPPQDANLARQKPCGTLAAYRRHLRHGDRPCEECSQARRDAVPENRRRRPPCGTQSGYRSHSWHKEPACQPCKDAEAKATREKLRARAAAEGRTVRPHAPAKCGTPSGAKKHRNQGEPVCADCLESERVYRAARRAAAPKRKAKSDVHGTVTAYRVHYARNEAPCDPCRAAFTDSQRERRARKRVA